MKNIIFKKVCLLLVAGILAAIQPVSSTPLTRQQASQNVRKFLEEKGVDLKKASMRHAPLKSDIDDQETAPYYVFNIGDRDGFVIASGDDRSRPILGYADEGTIDTDSMPDGLKWLLGFYEEQIQHAPSQAKSVKARTVSSYPAVEPLLTTKWNQYAPYNLNCPVYTNMGRCITGCVATAMAQIMYYHRNKSTDKLLKRIPGYHRGSGYDSSKITLDPIPKGAKIDWDNMLDEYVSGNYTDEQAQAVANLMLYCGASVDMMYGWQFSGSSSGLVPGALYDYFGYKKSEYIHRDNYTDEEWESIIYGELSEGRPIHYTGGNHAVVVDGHDGNGYVHVNWGWGGSSDGFYLFSAVEGSTEEVLNGYSSYQSAVISIEPDCPSLETVNITITGSNTIEGISNLSHIPLGLQMEVANNDDAHEDFYIGFIPLVEGKTQSWLNIDSDDAVTISKGDKRTLTRNYSIPSDLQPGLYMLSPYYEILDPNTGTLADDAHKLANSDLYVSLVVMDDRATFYVGEPNWDCDTVAFKDSLAKVYCLYNYDYDDNGELSTKELACVSKLESLNSINISSFDELRYFTGLKEIRDGAFSGKGITSIIIPENVTRIGNLAFNYTKLDSLFIPKNVRSIGSEIVRLTPIQSIKVSEDNKWLDSRNGCNAIMETATNTLLVGCKNTIIPDDTEAIGNTAFYFCQDLHEIILPESVTCIGDSAFYLTNITSVNLPANLIRIGDYAFASTRLTSIEFPEGLKSIGNSAFSSAQITSIEFPASVEELGDYAFCYTKLNSVFIPKNIRHIGKALFYSSKVSSIEVSEDNEWYDSRNGCNAIIETATNTLIAGCNETFIPDGVEVIGDNALQHLSLRKITIPESVRRIGKEAFTYVQIYTITIPKSVTSIEANAFYYMNITSKYIKALNPQPSVFDRFAFGSSHGFYYLNGIRLYVPPGCKTAYETVIGREVFRKIMEMGDVNGDGTVNITDVILTVNHILGNTPDKFDKVAADMNGDDAINISDITQMIQAILETTD